MNAQQCDQHTLHASAQQIPNEGAGTILWRVTDWSKNVTTASKSSEEMVRHLPRTLQEVVGRPRLPLSPTHSAPALLGLSSNHPNMLLPQEFCIRLFFLSRILFSYTGASFLSNVTFSVGGPKWPYLKLQPLTPFTYATLPISFLCLILLISIFSICLLLSCLCPPTPGDKLHFSQVLSTSLFLALTTVMGTL